MNQQSIKCTLKITFRHIHFQKSLHYVTPLHYAIQVGAKQIVKFLINRGTFLVKGTTKYIANLEMHTALTSMVGSSFALFTK